MPRELTPRQRQIMALIRDHIRDTGFPPTRAEIARKLGFRSANAAEEHLRALARRGVIELQPGISRGIRLLEAADDEFLLPVVGRVAAGSPILAEEHIEDHHRLDPGLFRPRADYLLQVHGSSMRDAGILDGDLLVVHRTSDVQNGQIVVARLEGEVMVKRFRRHSRWQHRVQLLPENPSFEPIPVDLRTQDLVIEGLGVGVLRMGLAGAKQL
jgi:repressor LexA